MSWSLKLTHGDFVLSGGSLATVTDEAKLVQDLRSAVLTPMGTDTMHPDYGSLLDGGRMPDGTVIPSVIGTGDWNQAAATVHSDLTRIVQNYQSYQLARAKSDRLTYGRATLTPGEALVAVSHLSFEEVLDAMQVMITVQNARGQDVLVALGVGSS